MSAPEKIYLQWHGDADPNDYPDSIGFNPSDVTWCVDQIYEHDIAYVAADIFTALEAERDRLAACLNAANEQAEHFERQWYLMTDERDRLASRLKECRAKHMDDLLALSATAKAERELRAELAECIAALEKIANPISAMKRALPVGATLNGAMATTLSNDPSYLKEIAKAALAARKGEGEQ